LPPHPYCSLFGAVTGEEYDELVESIKDNGLEDWITTYEGQVLDGKNRQAACRDAGIAPQYREWEPPDGVTTDADLDAALLDFVKSKNINRRHLTPKDRAMAAARIAAYRSGKGFPDAETEEFQVPHGTPKKRSPEDVLEKAATETGASRRSAFRAAKVLKDGDESVVKAVDEGVVSMNDAVEIVDMPPEAQKEAVEAVKSGDAKSLVEAIGKAAEGTQTKWEMAKETAGKIQVLINRLGDLLREAEDLQEEYGGYRIKTNELKAHIKSAQECLRVSKPAKECPKCVGGDCQRCGGSGWLSDMQFRAIHPEAR
jgi:ParB-like chromosome segregation protein Spo0J